MATTVAGLHSDFILYITPEKFYIEAIADSELLVIDRVSQEISLQVNHGQIPQASSSKPICGIVGTIQLLAGPYLVIITKKKKVGNIVGKEIWQVAETEISENKLYVSMVENVLNTPYLYFSYTYDITHTMQRLHNTTPEFLQTRGSIPLFWNQLPNLKYKPKPKLIQNENHGEAFSRHFDTQIFNYGRQVLINLGLHEACGDVALPYRTVARWVTAFRVGRDVVNDNPRTGRPHVENNTVQLLASLLDVDRRWTARELAAEVGVDHRGGEGLLEKSYGEMVTRMGNPNIRYESFDFHAECRHMKWDRLSMLIDRLGHEQDEFGCFLLKRDGTLVSLQDGVFRTNCIDCLDRTNVVQSMLARRSLTNIMHKLGILRPDQKVEDEIYFESLFKNVWADNADVISTQYSGTGALKTDFTRTGKRTKWGLIRDGINSLTRYYKNNFADGFRQDSIDLFLGIYMVEEGEGVIKPCPLEVEKGWKYITVKYTTESLLYLLFWGSMVAVTFATIMIYGTEFVDYPKLCEIRKISAAIE
ncbi:Phosphatidylinositide phosphatase SAC1 [Blattella germanica]|nr:Phosphatidylinositide phosphatase SAC1 [Blattella germanica]